jgi:hypothetical protein
MKDPVAVTKEGEYTIEYMFTADGCRMYRTNDGGRYIYWTNCQGSTQVDVTEGKTNTKYMVTTTRAGE